MKNLICLILGHNFVSSCICERCGDGIEPVDGGHHDWKNCRCPMCGQEKHRWAYKDDKVHICQEPGCGVEEAHIFNSSVEPLENLGQSPTSREMWLCLIKTSCKKDCGYYYEEKALMQEDIGFELGNGTSPSRLKD